MALFLVEFAQAAKTRVDIEPLLADVSKVVQTSGGEMIEAQIAMDLQRVYVVIEHASQDPLAGALERAKLPIHDIAPVRLVGTTLDTVKASMGAAEYLVEWDLPPSLTMETYLARKQAKSPLYANVPEVKFLRTYVREDMDKCLCFYDAPDEEAVRRARDVVGAPVDRLTRLAGTCNDEG